MVDINDNAPEFEQPIYKVQIPEKSPLGSLVATVSDRDLDSEDNGTISYTLFQASEDTSKTLEVNPMKREIRLRKQLDFETIMSYEVGIKVTDGGGLSGKCTLLLQVVDVNDNPPHVTLKQPGGAHLAIVVQKAWLLFQLLKATEPGLFRVWVHNGEVRTSRLLSERDAAKHRLLVLVKDNGQPQRSAIAMLHVLLVDSFSQPYLPLPEAAPAQAQTDLLTVYLVVALASVSSLFLFSVCGGAAVQEEQSGLCGSLLGAGGSLSRASGGHK
ncbi:hypothetical protein P7K49_039581 [Saguinus oedipus]|uniref:Cadherin domain-containing protein n=1 Tax=Saguinus oedipus TaxID=9490 RepID=A0ABQ9TAG5_SAGOE|nr:hypothetical protein P7K49_039581 [Saguinus oedipus]